jgi:hypothetical protein
LGAKERRAAYDGSVRRIVTPPFVASVALLAAMGCRQFAGVEDIEPLPDGGARDAAASDASGDGAARDAPAEAAADAKDEQLATPGCHCAGCTLLASGLFFPVSLLVSDSYVYFTNYGPDDGAGTLMRVKISGGEPETLVRGLDRPFALTSDADHLYWEAQDSAGGVIVTSPKSDPGRWRILAKGLPELEGLDYNGVPFIPTNAEIAVTATDVYFIGFDPSAEGQPRPMGIQSVPIDGGAVKPLLRVWPSDAGADSAAAILLAPLGIVTNGTSLVASNESPFGGVVETKLPAGPAHVVARDLNEPLALAIEGDRVFFCDDTPDLGMGTLFEAPATGGPPKVLLNGPAEWMIVPDGDVLFFIELSLSIGTAAAIESYDLRSKKLVTVVDKLASPQAIALDSESVYWVDPYCGALLKAPK